MPVGATFSTDGSYLLFTMDTRPPFGAFSNAPLQPTAAETVLLDLESGKRAWALRADDYNDPTYAVHAGFAAVASGGRMTALADYNGVVYLVDRSGKVVLRDQAVAAQGDAQHIGPPQGIGVSISDDGVTALFAFQSLLVIAREAGEVVRVPLAGVSAAALASDGSVILAAARGELSAFDPAGQPLWSRSFGATSVHLATLAGGEFLVATGEGVLLRLDAAGKDVWSANVAAAADRESHPLSAPDDKLREPLPDAYPEPNTLDYAKKHLQAEQASAWEASGPSQQRFGRKFFTATSPITLSTESVAGEFFLHLVYRRPAENKSLRIDIASPDGKEAFELDLATPAYRVVDLPLRGPSAKVTVTSEGPVEIAECSLWSFAFPGQNVAFVAPAAAGLDSKTKPAKNELADDDLLSELTGKSEDDGAIKKTRIWWPNPDPDQIAGPYLRAPLDPTTMVDGKRFGGNKINPWANRSSNYGATRGGFFTIDFGKEKPAGLVATYDRASKQSEVSRNFAIFSGDEEHDKLATGTLLTGETNNDQFWRLFPLKTNAAVLGVHVYRDGENPVGLSEVEVYKPE